MIQLSPVYIVGYYILLFFFDIVAHLFFRVRVVGRQNLITDRGFVLAGNHPGSISPAFIIMARGLLQKKMIVMGDANLYHKFPGTRWFWNLAGVFPVVHGTGNRVVVNRAVDEVQKGRGLLIFPEGGVSPKSGLAPLKSGAFVVAMEAGVDLIPCLIWYKAGWPKPFTRFTVAFGKPVTMAQLGLEGEYSVRKLRRAKELYTGLLQQLYEDNKDPKWTRM